MDSRFTLSWTLASLTTAALLASCGSRPGTDPIDGGHTGTDGAMPGMCPAPPAGISANARAAIDLENQVRSAMGVPCATMVTTINAGAAAHCQYYSANSGSCVSNPHQEQSGCSMFVATNFWDRMRAAGYTGSPSGEVMAFMGDGAGAVQQWIDSIWHRTPILDPWVRDAGYGNTADCDTMDFGDGEMSPSNLVAMYPYDGQIGVPVDFDGRFEGPPPPPPPSGWPSGYPITLYAMGGAVTEHTLVADGTTTPIPHMWIGHGTNDMGLLTDAYVMYANTPLAAHTTYHVHVGGTPARDWSFTTQ